MDPKAARPAQAQGREPLILSPEEAPRIWAESYDAQPNPLVALELRVSAAVLGPLDGRRALDVACGTGLWLAGARSSGAFAFGVDRSPEMLAHAAARAVLGGALVRGDACRLPLCDAAFDLARSAFCAGYVEDADALVAELARVVRPGGTVWLSDLHPEASRRGWKRGFRRGGTSYEIAALAHTASDLERAGRRAGLALEAIVEPHLGEPERELFRQAGKESSFEPARAIPALLALRWQRR